MVLMRTYKELDFDALLVSYRYNKCFLSDPAVSDIG